MIYESLRDKQDVTIFLKIRTVVALDKIEEGGEGDKESSRKVGKWRTQLLG